MTKAINIFYSDRCLAHDMGPGHVELAQRVIRIKEYLEHSEIYDQLNWLSPKLAKKSEIYLAHDRDYVDTIFANAPVEGMLFLDPDTSMSSGSLEATLSASGAAMAAVDMVKERMQQPTFCLTRPPGHHAEAHRAMGFCIFNHIALAACYAQQQGFNKIAVVDLDVHHGNGTENILKDKSDMLFLSAFQSPFYPFSGTEETASHIYNSPYGAGFTGNDFRELIRTHWEPVLRKFQPDLLLISAGFDAHAQDSISQSYLTEDDYFWVSHKLQQWTSESTKGRVISILEGGYNLSVLGPCVEAHLKGLVAQ